LLNERILGLLFAPDGRITGNSLMIIRLGDASLIAAGLIVVVLRGRFDRAARRAARRRPNLIAGLAGFAGAAFVLAAVELAFHAYNTVHARRHPADVVRFSAPLWQSGVTCRATKLHGDRVVYDVTYHRDERGARVTPDSPAAASGRDLVFFGCSFTFGQGVEDADSLPNQVARLAPGWRVTNFGYPGHGPAHMLRQLDDPATLAPSADSRLTVLYTFIPDQVRRTIGSMRIATAWGRDFPCYALSPAGALEFRGTMSDGRPGLTALYRWLAREPVLKCFNVDFPVRLAQRDLDLASRVILAARDGVIRQHPSAEFCVVLFPARAEDEFPASIAVPLLERAGIRILDYSDRLQGDAAAWIPGDGHPTPKAYAAVAQWLAADLALNQPRI
jgi:hypothetical protein